MFLSPKSGKENREEVIKKIKHLKKNIEEMELDKKVKEVWGEISEEGKKTYTKVKKEVMERLEDMQEKWEEFDREKYMSMVSESVDKAKSESKTTADKLKKLKDLFARDWNKVFGESNKT